MPDSPYSIAVNQYKAWLKTPEGRKASPEQQRLKRRSLFTATHKYRDPGKDLLRKREVFINSPQAANIRRLYEFTRRERPDLNAKGAFNVMVSQHPSLIKDLTPEQLNFVYSRYVTQDPRRRGTDTGVANSVYDSNLNPAENPSAFKRAVYSGALNFTTNVGRPVVKGMTMAPIFVSQLSGLGAKGIGYTLDAMGMPTAARYVDSAGNYLITAPNDAINYLIPAKTNEADAARGDIAFDKFNRATRAASYVVGSLLAPGSLAAASKAGSAKNMETALRAVAYGPKAPGAIRMLADPMIRHPWRTGFNILNFMGVAGTALAGAGDERTATDRELYGFREEIAPNGVTLVTKARGVSITPDGEIVSDGAGGGLFAADNQGLNSAIRQLPESHPLRTHAKKTTNEQYSDIAKKLHTGSAVIANSDGTALLTPRELVYDGNSPHDIDNTTDNTTDNKVPWYDSITEEHLWRGGSALGLGLAGASLGGWKGAIAAGVLGGLGYAYGNQLPVWWDKFMKAVNTK